MFLRNFGCSRITKTVFRYYSSKDTKLSTGEWIKPSGYDTGIQIYNCVAKKKVPLILKNKNIATWYTCGPTVYDSAHIGHASCYVKIDILQKVLKNYFNVNLITAMNITDIDDKIIKRSLELEVPATQVADQYEMDFWNELCHLNIDPPDIKVKVTDNMPEIIEFVQKLLDKDMAYKTDDGSVYFKTGNFPKYGKLKALKLDGEEHESKNSTLDFALWKGAKENEPSWDAPWGKGRPGWHIECSAMASTIFGQEIDFHAGGMDLKFPHHENEETQSCAYHCRDQWVNYWIHTGSLRVHGDEDKMSKSLKNTIGIVDMLDMFSAEVFRLSCLLSHYRSSMEFGIESMAVAEGVLKKILSFFNDAKAYTEGLKPRIEFNSQEIYDKIIETEERIDAALRDDFDTAKAIHSLAELATSVNKIINQTVPDDKQPIQLFQGSNPAAIQAATNFMFTNLSNFGLAFSKEYVDDQSNVNIKEILDNIVDMRTHIRETAITNKNKELFEVCDNIRNILKKHGVEIKDHGKLSSWNHG